MKLLDIILCLIVIFLCPLNAEAAETYKFHEIEIFQAKEKSITKESPWFVPNYRDVAFDDNGLIYALGWKHILVKNMQGNEIEKIIISKSMFHKLHKQDNLEVFGAGDKIIVSLNMSPKGNTSLIKRDGTVLKELDKSLNHLERRLDGTFANPNLATDVYDSNLDVIIRNRDRLDYATEWLDKDGNRFLVEPTVMQIGGKRVRKEDVLYKISNEKNKIWETKLPGNKFKIIGVDTYGNVYIVRKNLKILKYSDAGVELLNFPIKKSVLSDSILEKVWESAWGPTIKCKVTAFGDIYFYYTFEWFIDETFKAWLNEGGRYVVHKYELAGQSLSNDSFLGEHFKDKKYNDTKSYSKVDLNPSGLTDVDEKQYIRILRNEIFARHGRIFKSKDLNEIFESCKWYKPNLNYSDKMLNDIEKKNIQFILDYEKKMGWR